MVYYEVDIHYFVDCCGFSPLCAEIFILFPFLSIFHTIICDIFDGKAQRASAVESTTHVALKPKHTTAKAIKIQFNLLLHSLPLLFSHWHNCINCSIGYSYNRRLNFKATEAQEKTSGKNGKNVMKTLLIVTNNTVPDDKYANHFHFHSCDAIHSRLKWKSNSSTYHVSLSHMTM